jgi:Insulinase (Peptidase family M16)/Peptidase M16 inactive domain
MIVQILITINCIGGDDADQSDDLQRTESQNRRGSTTMAPEQETTQICRGLFARLAISAVLVALGAADAAALNEKLSNGVTLQTVHPAIAAGVQIRLLVPAGGRDDPRGREGLAHYVEHLLASDPGPLAQDGTEGAVRLSAHGYANAFTWPTATVYVMNVGEESLESALSLLADRLSRLDASNAIAERERGIVLQEYNLRFGANPGVRLMAELRMKMGLTDSALGWNSGTPDSIRTFDLLSAQAFFDRWYRPETMTLVLSGRLDTDNVQDVAERTIGLIPARPAMQKAAASKAAMSKEAGAVPPAPPSLVIERDDPDIAVPTVIRHLFVRATAGAATAVIREHAAMLALEYLLTGSKGGRKGLTVSLRDAHGDVQALNAGTARLDRRCMAPAAVAIKADCTIKAYTDTAKCGF